MFRSKSFTIAFSVLSLLIVGLLGFFLYLVIGNSKGKFDGPTAPTETEATWSVPEVSSKETAPSVPETSSEPESTSEAESTEEEPAIDYEFRAMRSTDSHTKPVIGEEIPEKGHLMIVNAGDAGEGLVFHKNPAFDGNKEGNEVRFSGNYETVGKIWILDNGKPALMYKTADGFYVTGSNTYVSYQSDTVLVPDPGKVGIFGRNDNEGALIEVFYDDGNHVVFSFYDNSTGTPRPLLDHVIAEYNTYGMGNFEYHGTDGIAHPGRICFENVRTGTSTKLVDIYFDGSVSFSFGTREEIVLHN